MSDHENFVSSIEDRVAKLRRLRGLWRLPAVYCATNHQPEVDISHLKVDVVSEGWKVANILLALQKGSRAFLENIPSMELGPPAFEMPSILSRSLSDYNARLHSTSAAFKQVNGGMRALRWL